MSKKHVAAALSVAAAILLLLAILTAMPMSGSKINGIGYASLCPFTPWSTLMLLATAGILWMVRGYVLTRLD